MKTIKILWAEDDKVQYDTCSTTLKTYLEKQGFQVSIERAVDGNAVYKNLINQKNYDVLIVDIEMPNWSGIDTVEDIHTKFPGLAMIIVSGNTHIPEFSDILPKLVKQSVIRGFYKVEPRENWCKSVLEIISLKAPNILHISDMHFGAFHAFKEKLNVEELLASIFNDIKDKNQVDLVIVSGDLSSRGETSEFEQAEKFLLFISNQLNISLNQILIVPGNHDIYRKEEPNRRFLKYIEFINRFYSKSNDPDAILQSYPELYNSSEKKLYWDSKVSKADSLFNIMPYDELNTVVIGLNSVISDDDRWHFGEISPSQLLKVSSRLNELGSPRSDYFRIAIFHHHLFVVPSFLREGEPERIVRNQGLVLNNLIQNRVKLVFHGHTHYSVGCEHKIFSFDSIDDSQKSIHVISTGTMSGQESTHSQSFFHLTMISCKHDKKSNISKANIYPYRLMSDSLNWQKQKTRIFKF